MAQQAMSAELFNELVEAVREAGAYHRGEKLNLRTTVLPASPSQLTPAAVKRLRNALRVSQAVFAHYLNVSIKLVQAWEGGTRTVDGPALKLIHIAGEHPELVFPIVASDSTAMAKNGTPARRRRVGRRLPNRSPSARRSQTAPTAKHHQLSERGQRRKAGARG
jgi:putative transcriptional regulator